MGTPLPHVKLGYQHMDDFSRSIPDVVSFYTNCMDGLLYVKAVPLGNICGSLFNVSFPEKLWLLDEGSAHKNELVREQRSAKKKKPLSSNYSMGLDLDYATPQVITSQTPAVSPTPQAPPGPIISYCRFYSKFADVLKNVFFKTGEFRQSARFQGRYARLT